MTTAVDFRLLLGRTSRTFDLAIPLLAEPQRHHLTLAYLLFRVADTLEDAEGKPRAERLAALADLREILDRPDPDAAEQVAAAWSQWRPSRHAGYMELIECFPSLLCSLLSTSPPIQRIIFEHTRRTVDGMVLFVRKSGDEGQLTLTSLDELRTYCYAVAGIVGEMITELFIAADPKLEMVAAPLRQHAADFGEGLQLVNILKDAADDARDGRRYLPNNVASDRVFQIARHDLSQAERWVGALEASRAHPGMIAFGKLPLLLARRTLDLVEQHGPGSKMSRDQVADIVRQVDPSYRLLGGVPAGLAAHECNS